MLLVAGVLRDVKVNSTVSFSEHAQNLMLFATTRSFWDINVRVITEHTKHDEAKVCNVILSLQRKLLMVFI